jgi:hypothetical protein
VLKRLGADTLRMGAKKRHRVIWVWDRAGIDFELWRNWKTWASNSLYRVNAA